MLKIMRLPHSEGIHWEDRARRVDWTTELERLTRSVLGKSHVLQPRRHPL